jgi:hypothetical protein
MARRVVLQVVDTTHEKAKEALKRVKQRDKCKVRIPHPTLPNTWLLVSPEKAKILTQRSYE